MLHIGHTELLYSFSVISGFFLAPFAFVLFFAVSYAFRERYGTIAKTYFIFSLGFLAFFFSATLMFSYRMAGTEYELSVHQIDWLKLSTPVGLFILSFSFTRLFALSSFRSHRVFIFAKRLVYLLMILNVVFLALIFKQHDLNTIILLSFIDIAPHLLLIAGYFWLISRTYYGKSLGLLLFFMVAMCLRISYELYNGVKLSLFEVNVTLSLFALFLINLGFSSIRFSYNKMLRLQLVQRIDTKGISREIFPSIENDHFFMLYQPLVCPKDLKPMSLEALIRWRHPTKGLISPDHFIQVCEEVGLIDNLCKWTIRHVLDQQKCWMDEGIAIPVAINFSVLNLSPRMIDFLVDEAYVRGIPHSLVSVEVTESLFLGDDHDAITCIERLHALGIRVAIDDYGTGFSSLSYMKHHFFSELKIDKCFISNMGDNRGDRAIVTSILTMCRDLDIKVVAEGVEQPEMLEVLALMGCYKAQGFAIAKPMNATNTTQWLEERLS